MKLREECTMEGVRDSKGYAYSTSLAVPQPSAAVSERSVGGTLEWTGANPFAPGVLDMWIFGSQQTYRAPLPLPLQQHEFEVLPLQAGQTSRRQCSMRVLPFPICGHSGIHVPRRQAICFDWNTKVCQIRGCSFEHACTLCGQSDHNVQGCCTV